MKSMQLRRAWMSGLVLLAACHGLPRHGRELLAHDEPERVLREVRPVGAAAFIVRGAALRRLSRLRQARTELMIGLSLDPYSAAGHREVALVEAELGNWGAARRGLASSLELEPNQPCVRRDLALLLLWRAWLRLLPVGFTQRADAEEDIQRVNELAPCLSGHAAAVLDLGRSARFPSPGPDGVCPGVPDDLRPDRPPPGPHCVRRRPGRQLRRLKRTELLLGCRGPRLALNLERAGCVAAAEQVWRALAREAPSEPLWPLQIARMLLARGEPDRAEPLLTSHVFLSRDRAVALLRVARTQAALGRPRSATRRAVEALTFADGLERQLEALRLIANWGTREQARQAARVILGQRRKLPAAVVRRRVEAALNSQAPPRRTPRR